MKGHFVFYFKSAQIKNTLNTEFEPMEILIYNLTKIRKKTLKRLY